MIFIDSFHCCWVKSIECRWDASYYRASFYSTFWQFTHHQHCWHEQWTHLYGRQRQLSLWVGLPGRKKFSFLYWIEDVKFKKKKYYKILKCLSFASSFNFNFFLVSTWVMSVYEFVFWVKRKINSHWQTCFKKIVLNYLWCSVSFYRLSLQNILMNIEGACDLLFGFNIVNSYF